MQWSPHSRLEHCVLPSEKKNVSFIVRILIDHMLSCSCNVKAEKCTGISQCPVNSKRRSSGWHSTVRETSLFISYGMNCTAVTKTIHINHIRNRETENLNGILNVKDRGRQEPLLNDARYNMSLARLPTPPPLQTYRRKRRDTRLIWND